MRILINSAIGCSYQGVAAKMVHGFCGAGSMLSRDMGYMGNVLSYVSVDNNTGESKPSSQYKQFF